MENHADKQVERSIEHGKQAGIIQEFPNPKPCSSCSGLKKSRLKARLTIIEKRLQRTSDVWLLHFAL